MTLVDLHIKGPSVKCPPGVDAFHLTTSKRNESTTVNGSPNRPNQGTELYTKLCRNMCRYSNVDDGYHGMETEGYRRCSNPRSRTATADTDAQL